jgi:hypothetical protein
VLQHQLDERGGRRGKRCQKSGPQSTRVLGTAGSKQHQSFRQCSLAEISRKLGQDLFLHFSLVAKITVIYNKYLLIHFKAIRNKYHSNMQTIFAKICSFERISAEIT